MVQPPSVLDAATIRAQVGPLYERFTAEEQRLHVDLLAAVHAPADVALHIDVRDDLRDRGSGTVTICAADAPGALALIAGLLTAAGLDIAAADLMTVRRPSAEAAPRLRTSRGRRVQLTAAPSRLLLDVFAVRPVDEGAPRWEAFHAEVTRAFADLAAGAEERALDRVIELVADAARARNVTGLLPPVTVELNPADASSPAVAATTALGIRGQDTPGFLFEFASALALIDVNIVQAEIRTIDGETRDIFFVTERRGAPITDTERLQELRVITVLIKQFGHLLPQCPDAARALRQFGAFVRRLVAQPGWTARVRDLESGEVLRTFAALMGVSEFLWEDFLRMQHESLFPVVADIPALAHARTKAQMAEMLAREVTAAIADAASRDALNAFKDREMFRIDLRHITHRVDLQAFSVELTTLAEVVTAGAADLVAAELASRTGMPRLVGGGECRWAVLALGKFGGRELGYASDIELQFVYDGAGETDGPAPLSNVDYFEHFVRAFLETIRAPRAGIFAIDLRLRPYGNAGMLASSEETYRSYYAPDGGALPFERLALVKMRAVAGDPALGARAEAARDAWVYSGAPLDLADLRHLRHRQATELVRSGETNAKYSPGGLVDVEYYVQARQIVVGARDPSVRVPGTLAAIRALVEAGDLDAERAARLSDAYVFLRRLIDGLRIVRGNARDLAIPARGTNAFGYLTRRLEYPSTAALADAIDMQMHVARESWLGAG